MLISGKHFAVSGCYCCLATLCTIIFTDLSLTLHIIFVIMHLFTFHKQLEKCWNFRHLAYTITTVPSSFAVKKSMKYFIQLKNKH